MKLELQTVNHLAALYELHQNPKQIHQAAFAAPLSWHDYQAKGVRNLANEDNLFYVIVVDGQIVGSVGKWVMGETAELAYWIGEEFEGKGHATEAIREFLHLYTARPLYAHVVADNLASIRVLEKVGFRRVGSFESEASARKGFVTELEFMLET